MRNLHRRKLKNFLLDRTYQLRHTMALVITCNATVILCIMGIYLYQEMSVAAEVVEVGVIATMRQVHCGRATDCSPSTGPSRP